MRQQTSATEENKRFGPYRVRRPLSSGGMGVLYEAEHLDSGAVVAIKTVERVKGATLAGLRAEVYALASLHHPGVVRILDQGVAAGCPWYAMELLAGETLGGYRDRLWGARARDEVVTVLSPSSPSGSGSVSGRAPPVGGAAPISGNAELGVAGGGRLGDVLRLLLKLCAPLAYVHGRGIVHRDLKPDNVILGPERRPILVDFGLMSRFPGPLGREVLEPGGALAGTLAYMPPEQIRRESVDARADLYAFGCVLFELVSGRHPFVAASADDLLAQHLHEPPPSLSRFVSGVPDGLDALVLRLLAKRPQDRLGHARDVAAALARVLGEAGETIRTSADGAEIAHALSEVPATSYLYRPEMVGRQAALAALLGQVQAAADGRGNLCLLGGESGLGKTMLAGALAREAGRKELRVITAECAALASAAAADNDVDLVPVAGSSGRRGWIPLHPFRPLLQALADHCRERGPETTLRLLGARARLLAYVEPALADLPGSTGGIEAPDLAADTARSSLLSALAEVLFEWARERPLVLVLDDVQWADELSLAFLQSLSPAVLAQQRVFVLATYRREELSPPLVTLLATAGGRRLEIERLDDEGVATMLAQILGMDQAPSGLAQFLSRTCAGNPFFVAEYVRTAVTEGLLRREEGRWGVAGRDAHATAVYDHLPLPSSLRGVLERRLAGMSPEATQLAEVASVLGREADPDLMAEVAEVDATAAPRGLSELVARQLLDRTEAGPLRFQHDKVRELIYEELSLPRRRDLHLRIGEALERRSESGPYLLAHHFRAAGRSDKAFRHAQAAGRHALSAGAYHEAHEHLSAALRLVDAPLEGAAVVVSPFEAAQLRRLIGVAATAIGDLDGSERVLADAHALVSHRLPRSGAGWALALGREAVRQLWHRLVPRRWIVASRRRTAHLEEAAEIANHLGFAYMFRNQPIPMLTVLARAANLAERADVPGPRAIPFAILGTFLGLFGATRASRFYFVQSARMAEAAGDVVAAVRHAQIHGFFQLNRAAWSEARALLEPALARSLALGIDYEAESLRIALASLEILTGDLAGAETRLTAVAASAGPLGNKLHEWWGAKYAAICLLHRGRFREALAVAQPAAEGFRQLGNVVDLLGVLAVSAAAQARLAEIEEAVALADEARTALSRNPAALYHTFELHSFLPEVYLSAWQTAKHEGRPTTELAAKARAAVKDAGRFARVFPIGAPMALRHRAALYALEGRIDRSAATLRLAAARATALAMPIEEGRALLQLAAHLPVASRERGDALGRAQPLLRHLGCASDLD